LLLLFAFFQEGTSARKLSIAIGGTLMRINIEQSNWKSELTSFTKRNEQRPTRLEVMEPGRQAQSNFWLEDGLTFQGIDLATNGSSDVSLEIMLQGKPGETENHMTHSVNGVRRVELELLEGWDTDLAIEDASGAITILRFATRRN
jgi:hypothetical protein